jgi:hypothetical protein
MFKRIINVAWATKNPIIVVIVQKADDAERETNGPVTGQLIDNNTTLTISPPILIPDIFTVPVMTQKLPILVQDATMPRADAPGAPAVGRTITQAMLDFYYAWQYPIYIEEWPPTKGFNGHTNLNITTPVGPIGQDTYTVTVINVGKILKYLIDNMTAEQYALVTSIPFSLEQTFETFGLTEEDDVHFYNIAATSYRIKPGKVSVNDKGTLSGIGLNGTELHVVAEDFFDINSVLPGADNPKKKLFNTKFKHMNFTVNKLTGRLTYAHTG